MSNASKALAKLSRDSGKAEAFAARRKGTRNAVVIKTRKLVSKPAEFNHTIQYNFLQYIRIVMRWAIENTDLNKGRVELLLYLYPIGLFRRSDFTFFHNAIGLYEKKAFQEMMDGGWIVLWRKAKREQVALYALTDKAKKLCAQMHRICTGEEEMPVSSANKLTSDDKVINKFLTRVIKKMNTRKASQ